MADYDAVMLAPISREKFNLIHSIFEKEEQVKRYVFFSFKDSQGIFYQGKLVGLFELSRFIDNSLAISIAILENYRGLGIAQITMKQIVEEYGKEYPDVKQFIGNVSPDNTSSNKTFKKLGWEQTHAYDEIMYEEGGNFYNIYYQDNPYFQKDDELKNAKR